MKTIFDPNMTKLHAHTCSSCKCIFTFFDSETYVIDEGLGTQYYMFNCPECETKVTKAVL